MGTSRAVTNAKNNVVWRWEGDAFGDVQLQVELVKMPLRFAGQYNQDPCRRIRAGRIAEINKQIVEFQRKLKLCEEIYGSKY